MGFMRSYDIELLREIMLDDSEISFSDLCYFFLRGRGYYREEMVRRWRSKIEEYERLIEIKNRLEDYALDVVRDRSE